MIKTTLLFSATVLCETIGCSLSWLRLKRNAGVWLLLPAGVSLTLFVWSLMSHPAVSGRVYAAYGSVYACTALMWLRVVDGVKPTLYDWMDALIALYDMLTIIAGWGRMQEHKSILLIRQEEVPADKRYSISSFVNHSQRKYTPLFVITPVFFDFYICMVVAQLRRFHVSRQAV